MTARTESRPVHHIFQILDICVSRKTMKHKLLLELPEILKTDTLVIRKYRRGDGEQYIDLFERNNNRELLKEHVDEATEITTTEEAEIRVREHAAEWEARTRFVMGVWLK